MAIDRAALTKQIKEANDIVAVIGGYLSVQATGNSHVYKALCPFHNDTRPSLQIDTRFQNYHCWACGKKGDVFSFIMEQEKVAFREARTLLARRVNIALEENDAEQMARMRQVEAIRWAAEQYHQCLIDAPLAEGARKYLGERRILGETSRKFGLGYAPGQGDWLMQRLGQSQVPLEVFEQVGLIGRRQNGPGHYDRFRDRVMFPVRNAQGQIVGFGGRVLPGTPGAERGPKYYNSAETPLFSKSELLYGLDQARQPAATAGYLAVVEGYTDVLMAHQMGVGQVVATMGTALNARHVQQLRRFVSKVVLVFDADEGGSAGVDRALAVFAGHNIELAIATLPDNLDPCDLLVRDGAEAFRSALAAAEDALDFKLGQLLEREAGNGVEGQRRVIDEVLGVISRIPDNAQQSIRMKRELMVTRLAHRLGVRETTILARLKELSAARSDEAGPESAADNRPRTAPALPHERELLELLLSTPALVAEAMAKIPAAEVGHPGLRHLLVGLYDLLQSGDKPEFDSLRETIENADLARAAMNLMDVGRRSTADRRVWFNEILGVFESRRGAGEKERLKDQLTAETDHGRAIELLRKIQGGVKSEGGDR